MYIIKKTASVDGARPPLQSWNKDIAPEGYALCPAEFFDVFYSTSPAGFVDITIESDIVTQMTVNQEALDAYIATHPADPNPQPTSEERLAAVEAENKLLTQQIEALSGQNDFLEECIVEMAGIVYA